MTRARTRGLRRGATRSGIQWPAGVRRVPARELTWTCDPARLHRAIQADGRLAREEAKGLREAAPSAAQRARLRARARLNDRPQAALAELVGQERAIEAIATGLGTEAPGFHVFVCGPRGSGRQALVQAALQVYTPPLPRPRDRVYVPNFHHPESPTLLTLPRGKGRRFRRDVDHMLTALRRAIGSALATEQHVAKSDRLRRRAETAATRVIEDLAAELRQKGLIVGPIPEGFGTPELRIEVGEPEPLSRKVVARRLQDGELKETRALTRRLKLYEKALARVEEAATEARAVARRGALALRRLDARVARGLAQGFTDDLATAYPTAPVRRWLDAFLEEVGDRVDLFVDRDEEREEERRTDLELLECFRANLFVDSKERPVPPVIFEPHPTYANLFGAVDPTEGLPDHLRLRGGALHRANGGVIVVDAVELLNDRAAWNALKRTVKSGWLEVPRGGGSSGGGLRPERIRTAFKLVAIGSEELYDSMYAYDPDFAAVFKVKVQVEEVLPRTEENVDAMAGAILRTARRAGLRTPDATALARLLEHSARLAGRNDRLAPWFSDLLDILQEADRLALVSGHKEIRSLDVDAALLQRRTRHDLSERESQEMLDDGVVLLELDGHRVGVVNALVVYDEGAHVYSRPTRVTAAVGVGRRGVVDLEREASFSGDSHHKGLEIVASLLRERYAQDKPLCLTATLCFEQSYSVVDGDSASLSEVLALFSALADVPLDQGWGITGSLNQKGEVQAIGDVTNKVEGFFDACIARGLTGRQGVIIPESNVRDLMLRPDVVKAVEKGRFHVAAVRTVDDALELVTGLPVGARAKFLGPFPEGSLNGRVDAKLLAYAEAARRFFSGPNE